MKKLLALIAFCFAALSPAWAQETLAGITSDEAIAIASQYIIERGYSSQSWWDTHVAVATFANGKWSVGFVAYINPETGMSDGYIIGSDAHVTLSEDGTPIRMEGGSSLLNNQR